MPNIIYVIDNLILAGAEKHLFNLVNGLKKLNNFNIEVVSLSGEGEIYDWFLNIGIPVKNYRMKNIKNPIFILDFMKLVLYFRRKKPDIVHTYLDTSNCFGVLAAKMAGVNKIFTSRRDLGVFRSSRMQILIGFLSNRVDKIVCVCEAVAQQSKKKENLIANNIEVIYNGIDVDEYNCKYKIESSNIIYCNVAVPNRKEKGHEDLINAFYIANKVYPSSVLRLIGDGPLLEQLKAQASNLGILNNVQFIGKSVDIPNLLKDVTVFVLPSHTEGISNALLEAMAMKIPVVVTEVGGNSEVITSSKYGILVEPNNPKSLANGMINIVKDKDKLNEMGHACYNHVRDNFSLKKMIRRYKELYNF